MLSFEGFSDACRVSVNILRCGPRETTNRKMDLGNSVTKFVVVACILSLAVHVSADGSTNERNRRSRNDVRNTMFLNKGTSVDCFEAFKECRKIPECRTALRGLKDKCKVYGGKCGAEMVDLPRCGQIMDHLFQFGFPEERCRCDRHMSRCIGLLNKIYANPCFESVKILREKERIRGVLDTRNIEPTTSVLSPSTTPTSESTLDAVAVTNGPVDEFDVSETASIKHLRENNLFPKEVDAYDEVTGYNPPSPTVDSSAVANGERPSAEPIDKIDSWKNDYEEFFGDLGFGIKRPQEGEDKAWFEEDDSDKSIDEILKQSGSNPQTEDKAATTTVPESGEDETTESHFVAASDIAELQNTSTHGRQVQDRAEKKRREEDTDFRVIAIVLGVLLGIFILGAVIFFAWTRSRGAFFYTSGKLVRDHRTDEGVQTKSPSRPLNAGTSSNQHRSRA